MRGVGAAARQQVRAVVPGGTARTVEEIAAAACYLASEEAGYISGHTLVVDGGWTANDHQVLRALRGADRARQRRSSGTPADQRRYSNERSPRPSATRRDVAQTMDELGYYCLWTAEHHFQREGYEVLPNLILLLDLAGHPDEAAQVRLRLQHPAHVASHPAGRGLRDGRHPHGRARDHGRGPGLSHPRGGDVRRAHARQRGQQGAVRGADGGALQVLQRGILEPSRQALRPARRRFLSRLHAARPHLRAAAHSSPRRDVAADRQRQDDRVHGQPRHQGHGDPQRRADRGADHCPGLSRGGGAGRPSASAR